MTQPTATCDIIRPNHPEVLKTIPTSQHLILLKTSTYNILKKFGVPRIHTHNMCGLCRCADKSNMEALMGVSIFFSSAFQYA